MRKHSNYRDVPVGRRFGRLIVIALAPKRSFKDRVRWQVRCDCGLVVDRSAQQVAAGITSSCGCLQRDRAKGRHPLHGMSYSPEYNAWCQMKERCTNPRNPRWKDYGGRGISVCARWMRSFPAFLADTGGRPSPRHSLGRLKNDGNYEPGNCAWQTPVEQRANRRDSKDRGRTA